MIFPDLLGASLRVLGSKPVLKNENIVSIAELDLDIHEQWFSEEVRNFTPYTRQDTSQQEHTDALIKTWGNDALNALTETFQSDLANENALKDVALMRKEVLQTWLTSKRDARGMNTRQVLEELRLPFTSRMEHLIKDALSGLKESISTPITEVLENWSSSASDVSVLSLWEPSALSMDTSDGAMMFREAIVDRRMGTSTSIKAILQAFEQRAKVLEDVQTVIRDMKSSRWEDDFDDDDDEDDADYESTRDSLTRIDPQELQVILVDSTKTFVQSIEHFFTTQLESRIEDCSSPSSPGLWTLRIIRGLRLRLPRLLAPINKQLSQTLLCQDLVVSLQASIKDTIDSKTTGTLTTSLNTLVSSNRQARILWDGAPLLPVMPTPATFRYLRVVVKEMETLGTDLWNPELARLLKRTLQDSVAREIKRLLDVLREKEEKAVAESRISNHTSSDQIDQTSEGNPGDSAEPGHDGTDGTVQGADETEDANGAPVVQAEDKEDNYVRDVILAAPNSLANTPRPSSPLPSEANQDPSGSDAVAGEDGTAAQPGTEATHEQTVEKDMQEEGKTETQNTTEEATSTATHSPTAEAVNQTRLRMMTRTLTHDKLTQLLFDVAYLQLALHCASDSSTSSSSTVSTAASTAGLDVEALSRTASDIITLRRAFQPESEIEVGGDDSKSNDDESARSKERQRIEKAAAEYWRRTYALFGLLGVS